MKTGKHSYPSFQVLNNYERNVKNQRKNSPERAVAALDMAVISERKEHFCDDVIMILTLSYICPLPLILVGIRNEAQAILQYYALNEVGFRFTDLSSSESEFP